MCPPFLPEGLVLLRRPGLIGAEDSGQAFLSVPLCPHSCL